MTDIEYQTLNLLIKKKNPYISDWIITVSENGDHLTYGISMVSVYFKCLFCYNILIGSQYILKHGLYHLKKELKERSLLAFI